MSSIKKTNIMHVIFRCVPYSVVMQLRRLLNRLGKYSDYNWNQCNYYKNKHENTVLQGSALIFSKLYFKKEKLPFYPETRFYFEEPILAENIKKNNFNSLFTNELKVVHRDRGSTKKSHKNEKDYSVYVAENMINSFKIYEQYVKEHNG